VKIIISSIIGKHGMLSAPSQVYKGKAVFEHEQDCWIIRSISQRPETRNTQI